MKTHKTEEHELKGRQGFEWIKAKSGNTYLCPVGSIVDKTKAIEEDLRKVCVDESINQND